MRLQDHVPRISMIVKAFDVAQRRAELESGALVNSTAARVLLIWFLI